MSLHPVWWDTGNDCVLCEIITLNTHTLIWYSLCVSTEPRSFCGPCYPTTLLTILQVCVCVCVPAGVCVHRGMVCSHNVMQRMLCRGKTWLCTYRVLFLHQLCSRADSYCQTQQFITGVNFMSGCVGGTAATVVSFPFDVLRTRMISQGKPKVGRG